MSQPTKLTKHVTKRTCTLAEEQLLQHIENFCAQNLWYALQFVHDTALYNSEINIQKDEKADLFVVKKTNLLTNFCIST